MEVTNNQLLRFTTAGSVDDGKSTLIGRLLYDSKSIFEDQLSSIEAISARKGKENIDLALFTDGLRDEREQGITIDVAYRYFTTPKRKFIIADTPGHIQYTRNMVTGASTANAALILIDARKGVVEQTKRHSFIASLLQIPHVIVCVNKMDLVEYSEQRFEEIKSDYEAILSKMSIKDVRFIPISALQGDNVVHESEKMRWYKGAPLLHTLENIHIGSDINKIDTRFPVQTIIRVDEEGLKDYRAYSGRLESGIFRVGDPISVLPSGFNSRIKSLNVFGENVSEVFAPMSIAVELEDEIDVSRGDMLVRLNNRPETKQEFEAMLCWLANHPFSQRSKFIIKHTTNEQTALIKSINYKMDIETLERNYDDLQVGTNDICRVSIKCASPLMVDEYRDNRATGSFILIDPNTNNTVAAGMII
jgi:sulfate adenylyltransferase subunit 1